MSTDTSELPTDDPASITETDRACNAIEEFIDDYVQESCYAAAPKIAKQVDVDVLPQSIGQVISEYVSGGDHKEVFEDVRVGRWSEAQTVTWYFERVAGEPAPDRLVDRKRKIDIVLEISEAIGAEGAETYTGSRHDEREYTKISLPKCWMYDVLEAVFAKTGHDLELGDEDDDRGLREQLGDLSRDECSAVLEQAVDDVTITGNTDHWNKKTCAEIHRLLVGDGGERRGN